MALSEREYDERALPELSRLVAALDELEDDTLEAELASDILTLEFSDGTRYVINSHRAARQIWMAAERSAWHFDYDDGRWVAAKTGEELWAVVEGVLARKLGHPVRLGR
ncbi:MAG TPA: iron donor protein CyaY [Polyangiaceae bacterium]|nr:iron donor protein CyaY [Polyangiaceae bacterium]